MTADPVSRFQALFARAPFSVAATAVVAVAVLAAGCASVAGSSGPADPPPGPAGKHHLLAVTAQGELLRVNANRPGQTLSSKAITGLAAGDRLVGIDFRIARGVLYALSASGRLYTLNPGTGALTPVGSGAPLADALRPGTQATGLDFNPVADRIRVVTSDGRNLRLHPDTGVLAAQDPALKYADGDAAFGQAPKVAAAGYTYNKANDKLTTNYAIDTARGTLVRQGSVEGTAPVVSPNTGLLATVGSLGVDGLDAAADAALDVADTDNSAFATLRSSGRTRLYAVDLATGRATLKGSVAGGVALLGLAIEP